MLCGYLYHFIYLYTKLGLLLVFESEIFDCCFVRCRCALFPVFIISFILSYNHHFLFLLDFARIHWSSEAMFAAIDWFISLFVGLVVKFWFKCIYLNSLFITLLYKHFMTNNCTYIKVYILMRSPFISIWVCCMAGWQKKQGFN